MEPFLSGEHAAMRAAQGGLAGPSPGVRHRAGCWAPSAAGACCLSWGEDAKSSPEAPAKPQQALLKQKVKSTSLNKARRFRPSAVKLRVAVAGERSGCPEQQGCSTQSCTGAHGLFSEFHLLTSSGGFLCPLCFQPKLLQSVPK